MTLCLKGFNSTKVRLKGRGKVYHISDIAFQFYKSAIKRDNVKKQHQQV